MVLNEDEIARFGQIVERIAAIDKVNSETENYSDAATLMKQMWGAVDDKIDLEVFGWLVASCQQEHLRGP